MIKLLENFSIVLKRLKCSNCETELNYFRFPKNVKQFLWGGYSCSNCKCELDKFGNKI